MSKGFSKRNGWREVRLGDVVKKVAMGPFGSNIKVETFKTEGIPIISGQHLHEVKLRDNEFNFITEEHADKLSNSNVFRGDVVLTHAGNIGQVSFIPKTSRYDRYIVSQRQFYLRCDQEKIDYEFIVYYFRSPYGQHQILVNSGQTGVPSLAQPVTSIKNLKILTPPLPEQKKIASILTSVDEVIENTHKQIDKLQDLKKATMNELLTKGIGHTEFKDSELGRIPKSWEVVSLGDITTSIKSGLSRQLSLQDIGLPVINSANLTARGLDTRELKYWYVDDPQGAKTENYFLEDGDILLNFINSVSQIGKSCIFRPFVRPCIFTTNIFRIRVRDDYDPEFVHSLMLDSKFQLKISLITKPAVNQASFTKEDLSRIALKIPPLPEQKKIASILASVDEVIENTQKQIDKRQDLKKSLIQDLLTGKVRVSVD